MVEVGVDEREERERGELTSARIVIRHLSLQANGRKGSGGSSRSGSGPPGSGGQGPQPLHFSHQHHRDALNRAGASSGNFKLPPPPPLPPPSYRSSSGPPYGSSAPGSGGRGSFSGGNSGASGGFVQPGLMPASSSMGMGMQGRHGSSGGSGGMAASPFGGSGGSRDAPRPRLGQDTYGASGYSNLGYGGSSAGTGVGGGGGGGAGGGSMVQLGLSSGLGDRSTSTPKGAYDGSMYGRESGRGGGVLAMDTYGGSSSYDMAAGHKRNYSTAMQVRGAPWSMRGLIRRCALIGLCTLCYRLPTSSSPLSLCHPIPLANACWFPWLHQRNCCTSALRLAHLF